jgi:hypothetical protein
MMDEIDGIDMIEMSDHKDLLPRAMAPGEFG